MSRRRIYGQPRVGPRAVTTFPEFILATGGQPLLRIGDQRLLRGPFYVSATITDNAVVAQSLTTQSLWDKRVTTLYGASASTTVKGILHLAGVRLYIPDANYRGETEILKASLDNLAYIHTVRAGKTMDFPLRFHVAEPWGQFDFKQTAAATEERVIQSNPPWFFERPYRIDLETDQFTLQVDTAINWATTNIAAFIEVWGHMAPKEFPNAQMVDSTCEASSVPFETASPLAFADLGNLSPPTRMGYLPPVIGV